MVGSMTDQAEVDKAVQRVRDEILAGGLAPGTTVTVSGLAKRFGADDAQMHHAVVALTEEGLIEAAGHEHRIANLGRQQAVQLLDVMGVVLVALFERAAPRLSPDEINRMATLADDLRTALQHEDMLASHRAIGDLVGIILQAGDHQELRDVNTHVLDRSLARLHLFQHAIAYPIWTDGWVETVQYLQRGQPEAAVERLRRTFWILAEELAPESS
ncbi:GntR family transcriptional regulator [Arthrobacter sp. CAU 1506]|nr:GntR family transcriptional regulator [Arthrobacter sp. CAU 1506]